MGFAHLLRLLGIQHSLIKTIGGMIYF